MKRGLHKELGPGLWAGVGGHMDLQDIKNPRALELAETCYREVEEETGIKRTQIRGLALRYMVVSRAETEIRIVYHYFGEVEEEISPPKCEEGEFFWINKEDALNRPMSASVKEAIKHWVANPGSEDIYFICVNKADDSAVITQI